MSQEQSTELLSLVQVVKTGSGKCFPLGDDVTIGRDPGADISVRDVKVSWRHCRIIREQSVSRLTDLDSNNGTWVNEKRVMETEIRPGDVIRVGRSELRVVSSQGQPLTDSAEDLPSTLRRSRPITKISPFILAGLGIPKLLSDAVSDEEKVAKLFARAETYAIALEFAKALQHPQRVAGVLRTALGLIFKFIDAERGYIALLDPLSGAIEQGLARHRDAGIEEIPIALSATIVRQVLAERRAVLSTDAMKDVRFDGATSVVVHTIRSVLCVPLMFGNELIGVLQLDTTEPEAHFDDEAFELAKLVGTLVGIRVSSAREFEKLQDPMPILKRLTGSLREASFERLESLVREYDNLAGGEESALNLQRADLTETLKEAIGLFGAELRHRGCEVHLETQPMPLFEFDPSLVRLAVNELLRNAAEAMTCSGQISVRCGPDGDSKSSVRIEITDQGQGVADATRDRIWEPFFSTAEETRIGLGLTIVRRVIERHGGPVSFASESGKGTTFSVVLPIEQA